MDEILLIDKHSTGQPIMKTCGLYCAQAIFRTVHAQPAFETWELRRMSTRYPLITLSETVVAEKLFWQPVYIVCHMRLGSQPCVYLRASKYMLLPVFLRIFSGVRIYHKFYGISSVILGKFMACFFIVPMEKQAINFPKLVHSALSCCQV